MFLIFGPSGTFLGGRSAERSWHEKHFLSFEIFNEKCSETFPKLLGLDFVGPKKSRKIPAKFREKFPLQKIKKIHERVSAGVQGEAYQSFLRKSHPKKLKMHSNKKRSSEQVFLNYVCWARLGS